MAVLTALLKLLVSGRVQEFVGGVQTSGDHHYRWLAGSGRKVKQVPIPSNAQARVWPAVVRYYDDENNFNVEADDTQHTVDESNDKRAEESCYIRVPADLRKTYRVNAQYCDVATAAKEGWGIQSTTTRGGC